MNKKIATALLALTAGSYWLPSHANLSPDLPTQLFNELENALLCQSTNTPRRVVSSLEKSGVLTAAGEGRWLFTPPAGGDAGIWKLAREARLNDEGVQVAFHGQPGELGPILKRWTERQQGSTISRIRSGAFYTRNEQGQESQYWFNPQTEVVLICQKSRRRY